MGFEELKVLPDVFQRVCKRTEDGEKFTKDIIKYLEKRAKAEVTYSKTLQHLNVELFKTEQEIGTMKDVWNSLKVETDTISQGHENFSTKLTELVESLKSAHMEERKNRALLVAKGNKLIKDLAAVESTMKKARSSYVDLRKTQDKSAQALEKAKQTGDPKKESAAQKQYEKDENKAEKSDNEYRISVNGYKAAQDTYFDSDLPSLLKEFEAYEKRRSETTRNFFEQFVTLQEVIGPHTKDATERIRKKISAVNARSDLDLFVMQQDAKNVPAPARAVYVSYNESDGPSTPISSSSAPKPASSSSSSAPPPAEEKKKGGLLGGVFGKRTSSKADDKEKNQVKSEPKKDEPKAAVSFTTSAPKVKPKEETATTSSAPVPALATASTAGSTAKIEVSSPKSPTASATVTATVSTPKETPPNGDAAGAGSQEVVALYDYEATEEGELTFAEGEKITLLEQDDSGWWKGRNAKGVVGVFPSNFVELIGGGGDASTGAASGSGGGAVEINADYRALYDYDAEDDTELTIKEGDILHVDGWYYGTRKTDGKAGNFPSNFVEPV